MAMFKDLFCQNVITFISYAVGYVKENCYILIHVGYVK